MSLLDMRDIPVALHAQRQLFLDNVVVASKKRAGPYGPSTATTSR